MDSELYTKLEKLMAQDYFLDKDLTVRKVATLIGTNRSYLFNFFSKNMDITFVEYINSHRLRYAYKIVSKRDVDAVELSELCGFKREKSLLRAISLYNGEGWEFLKNRYLCKKIKQNKDGRR